MMKLLVLSDLHLVEPGDRLYGLDPAERAEACFNHVLLKHADAAGCIVSGDLTDRGQAGAYRWLRQRLKKLPMPVNLMLGNHDDRGEFLSAFSHAEVTTDGFVQDTVQYGDVFCVLLDTLVAGTHSGALCESRLRWLDHVLSGAHDKRVWLFMHHPPLDIGIAGMDRIRLMQPEYLHEVLTRHSCIEQLFFGHVHRRLCGQWHGIPFSGVGSTNHHVASQFAIDAPLTFSYEAPSYAVVLADAHSMVVHFEEFLDDSSFVRS